MSNELTIESLTAALRTANEIAISESSRVPDNGTCNFDSVVIEARNVRGKKAQVLQAAAAAAGIRVWDGQWLGQKVWFVNFDARGQAAARTAGVRAAAESLKQSGIGCHIYYQMD